MNRRVFLKLLAAATAAARPALDGLSLVRPEFLLDRPVPVPVSVMIKAIPPISMRFIQSFDITQHKFVNRLDTMYGMGYISDEEINDRSGNT